MGLNISEQETSVSFSRDSDICSVYTSDTTVMTKLDKLAESDKSPHWRLKEEHRLLNGELIGKTYETHKRLISFRSNISTREMSNEQKEAASERFRKMWKDRQEEKKKVRKDEYDKSSKYISN